MELTHSQYGALVDAFVQAFVDVMAGTTATASATTEVERARQEHQAAERDAVRAEAVAMVEDNAVATYEQIQEDPRNSTGWNAELWDNLVVGLVELDYAQSGIDAIVRRAVEIAGTPMPGHQPGDPE